MTAAEDRLTAGLFLSRGADTVATACAAVGGWELRRFDDSPSLCAAASSLDAVILQNAVYSEPFARTLAEDCSRLRWIQAAAAGVDAFQRHGLPAGVSLTNAGDTWAPCVADHALALLLALARGLPQAARLQTTRRWDGPALSPHLLGLRGRRLLVVGLGAIGRGVATRALAFGMQVEAVTRSPTPAAELPVFGTDQLFDRLPLADAVVLCVPLTAATARLIDGPALAAMKPSAILVNVARGGVVEEAALCEALRAGHLAGAATDVAVTEPLPDANPLWDAPRLLVTPHVAAFDDGPGFELLAELCSDNLRRFRDGMPLRNQVTLDPRQA